jgi:hypothetical protein
MLKAFVQGFIFTYNQHFKPISYKKVFQQVAQVPT